MTPTGNLTPEQRQVFDRLQEKILREYTEITLSDAVESTHFSRSYFSKLFRQAFGMPFTQYLNTVKVAAAIGLLREEKHSIAEISGLCGFESIRNFNRVFRNLTGYAPTELPKEYKFGFTL